MTDYRIAVIPGDGGGPEVSEVAMRVVDTTADHYGFGVEFTTFDWSCDRYLEVGEMMPDDALGTQVRGSTKGQSDRFDRSDANVARSRG